MHVLHRANQEHLGNASNELANNSVSKSCCCVPLSGICSPVRRCCTEGFRSFPRSKKKVSRRIMQNSQTSDSASSPINCRTSSRLVSATAVRNVQCCKSNETSRRHTGLAALPIRPTTGECQAGGLTNHGRNAACLPC